MTDQEKQDLLEILHRRFESHRYRHEGVDWEAVVTRLVSHEDKLRSLFEMERTGGEVDVIGYDPASDTYLFCDCSEQTPSGRRNLCYDEKGLNSRKEFKPANSAVEMARAMGVELLTEEEYRFLQSFGPFDTRTSSWLKTPPEVRELGGALFGEFRYGRVFIYHNGAQSYYKVRGFRGILRV